MRDKGKEISENWWKFFVKALNMLTLTTLSGGLLAVFAACVLTWVLLLPGCCGEEVADPDLVVVNDSEQAVYAITLDYGDESCTVQNARGDAMLKQGESYGLMLERERATVTLSGRHDRELARVSVVFQGERLCLTVEEGGAVLLQTAESARNQATSRSTQAP